MGSGARQGFGLTDPHSYLRLGRHIPLGKLAAPLSVNQYVTSSPHPANHVSPGDG